MTSFKEASDALRTLVLLDDIALVLGASAKDVRNMRRDSSSRKFLSAPDGWEEMIAGLAEKHADAMADLAVQLRLRGKQLEQPGLPMGGPGTSEARRLPQE